MTGRAKKTNPIDGMAHSVQTMGLLHPIVITRDGMLIDGHRRIEAIKVLRTRTRKGRRL